MTTRIRRESIDAIQRSGRVLSEARREQERIQQTLERSRELDRRQRNSILTRLRRP